MSRTIRIALWPVVFTLRFALFFTFLVGASLAVAEHHAAKAGRA